MQTLPRFPASSRHSGKSMTVKIALRNPHRLKAISLSAMALNISTDDGHPNKMPFSGILVRLDEPSDAAPTGSHGRKIIVTTAAAKKALSSLLGMAVGFTPSLDGHDVKNKIGIITSADIVGSAIQIAGFIYAANHPEIASTIKAQKSALGFSFEAQRLAILDSSADVLTITDLAFTGAAIIRRDKAAYTTTSIAASAATTRKLGLKPEFRNMEIDMTPEELKAMIAETVAQAFAATSLEATIKTALDEQAATQTKQDETTKK